MLTVSEKKIVPVSTSHVSSSVAPYIAVPATSVPGNGLTLEGVWRRLMRQKWTLLLTMLAVILLTVWNTLTTVPTYRAGATIQIEKETVQIVNFGAVSSASPDMGTLDPFFRTQYEQLKSRKLAQQVISDLDLKNRLYEHPEAPGLLKSLGKIIKRMVTGLLPGKSSDNQAAVAVDYADVFIRDLYIEPVENTHLVKVFYESPEPTLAAEIVNALIAAFIRENISSQSETDAYARDFLEQELEKARSRLTTQESKLVEYAKQNGILEVNNSQSTQERKLDELYSALGEAERARIQAESQMIQGRKHGNVREVLNNPVVEGIKQNLVTLEAEYQEKLKLFKPAYPDMQRLQQQIAEVRRQLQQEISGLKQSLQADFSAARKLEDDLRAEVENYKAELVSQRDRSIEYNALKREVETSRNLYDGLLQRMKEVSVAANATSSNIRIVDTASTPKDIFRPKKSLNLILGSLVGLMLGVGAALLRETLNQTVASVNELQALSGLPVLGTIPHVRNLSEGNLALAAVRDMSSSLAEAYRVATANLRFVLPAGVAPRITLITSVNPGEGKSTSAVNIALSQAQQGLKVLLIDADLRKPSIHFKMGLPNLKGLSNFLMGETDIASVTQSFREVKGFYLISAGTLAADPVRMVSSPAMAQLLNLATRHFDSVIIDGPPVAGFADAIYLSSLAQATVLVADEDHINRKRLLNAIEQLRRVKQNVVGFLMVKSQEDVTDYRYYDRYQTRIPSKPVPKAAKSKRKGLNLAPGI
ncbi:MAG: polysaccharide biosynthesis tyrosine autokinase [Gammaproteobacteria bacterium]|nr:polysaccharide biosynthesis tyrosine autokinase [Gammaproteobacteria bacterium]MBU1724513.1 polysaccharide biosynthesis tyrosine autokinase [Gammaproteobacteria bacterium]MBU2004556.1 polysaccharide biosynthesis tyrosine autokinase [Gammaproteobacteria bacterium]